MSGRFAHIARCLDLRENDVVEALAGRTTTIDLLTHLASVAAPNTGVAKVLLVYARMATNGCDWIDGDLCIEIVATADATVIEAATELGGGLRERFLPPMTFSAPIDEFTRAVDRVPHMILPLAIRAKSPRGISLSAMGAQRKTTAPPPAIEISSDSLFVRPSMTSLPKSDVELPARPLGPDDVDGGWEK